MKGDHCRQLDQMATSKGILAKHKRAVHEGLKYPSKQCNHMATSKDILVQYKGAVHEGVATLFQETLFKGTSFQGRHYSKEKL